MTAEVIMQMLSNFAFPVVAFIICCYALKYSYDKGLESNNRGYDAIQKITEAVNQNTVTLTKLVEKVEDLKND